MQTQRFRLLSSIDQRLDLILSGKKNTLGAQWGTLLSQYPICHPVNGGGSSTSIAAENRYNFESFFKDLPVFFLCSADFSECVIAVGDAAVGDAYYTHKCVSKPSDIRTFAGSCGAGATALFIEVGAKCTELKILGHDGTITIENESNS